MTNRLRTLLWSIGLLGLLAFLALEPSKDLELELTDAGGSTLAVLPLPDGRFDHVYVHSVHRTPVVEKFRTEGAEDPPRLHLHELRYQSQGVGMPSDAEGGFRLEGDTFVLAMDRSFDRIPVMVSPVEGHGLVIQGAFIPFVMYQPPGRRITLSLRTSRHIRLRRIPHHE
jgi:hypothetical protein